MNRFRTAQVTHDLHKDKLAFLPFFASLQRLPGLGEAFASWVTLSIWQRSDPKARLTIPTVFLPDLIEFLKCCDFF